MKKFFMSLFAVAICISTCVGFSACSKGSVAYNTPYGLSTIGMMGFKGSSEDIKMYLNSVNRQEETNAYASYIDVITRIELSFGKDGKGTFKIRDIGSLEIFKPVEDGAIETEVDQYAKAIYDQLVKNGIIKEGSIVFDFEFSQDGDQITIELVHTTIKGMGIGLKDDGDITFGEALDLLANFNANGGYGSGDMGVAIQITNDDVNKLTAKDGKLSLKIGFSVSLLHYRSDLPSTGNPIKDIFQGFYYSAKPDIATDIVVTFAK